MICLLLQKNKPPYADGLLNGSIYYIGLSKEKLALLELVGRSVIGSALES